MLLYELWVILLKSYKSSKYCDSGSLIVKLNVLSVNMIKESAYVSKNLLGFCIFDLHEIKSDKRMSKFLKILAGVIIVMLALMIVVPYFFKDQILEKVKTEMNDALDATVEVGDVSLSLFRDFPNLYVEIRDVAVIGQADFQGDTLVVLNRFYTGVDLASVIRGNQLKVGSIVVDRARVNARVLENGRANWNIVKSTDEVADSTKVDSDKSSDFSVLFDQVRLTKCALMFEDASQKVSFGVDQLDLSLSGDFSVKSTNLTINTTLAGVEVVRDDVKYLKHGTIGLEAVVAADLEKMSFTFMENRLSLNNLEFMLDGRMGVLENGYDMDLKLKATKTDFKTLLSLVPDLFKTDMKGIETTGELSMDGFARGEYYEDHLPAFGVNLKVGQAQFKYPDLPKSVDNISLDVQVNNPGGNADHTVVDVNRVHFEVAQNPFDASMHIMTPVSDPQIKGVFKGVIDFAQVRDAIPMDSVKISGKVTADVSFDGRLSSIEKERYQEFSAKGDVKLKDFAFTTKSFPQEIKVLNSVLNFTPRYINLKSFDSRIGKSDVQLSGKIQNYIPYALKGKTLIGNFLLTSNEMDLNEFMSEQDLEATKEATTDTIPLTVIEIPANLNLKLVSKLKKVHFDKMDIENIKGVIQVKNSVARLSDLTMDVLQGASKVNGSYDVRNVKLPSFDFALNVTDVNIASAYTSLSVIKKMIPIAMNCEGKISSNLKIASQLDQQMSPVMKTVNGKGDIRSKGVVISGAKAFDELAVLLKNDDYKNISVSQFNLDFVVKDGNVEVLPFKTRLAGQEATIYGTQGVDGKLNFTMDMKIPKKELGDDINKLFDILPGYDAVLELDVAVKISGTVSDPKVNLDLRKAMKQAQKAIVKELQLRSKEDLKKAGKKLGKELEKQFKKWLK